MRESFRGVVVALMALAVACSDDPSTGSASGGSSGSSGSGGAGDGAGGAAGAGASSAGGAAGGAGDAGPSPLEPPKNPGWPGAAPLLDPLDQLCTFVLVGPSDAAGYKATGLNAPGGHGFARLVFDGGTGAFAGKDLVSLHPGVAFVDQSESGFTTTDMKDKLLAGIGSLDAGADGCDTWVHFGSPGNDFNDNPLNVISASGTATVAATARANYVAMMDAVRGAYEDASAGHTLVVSFSTVQDPTDGTGKVPEAFTEGFCSVIHNPAFTDELRAQAIVNLGTLNAEIAAEAAAQGGGILDQHGAIFGHAMPAADRWLADDCTHPNDAGHEALHRYAWYLAAGEWP